jgi:hypothetical protein
VTVCPHRVAPDAGHPGLPPAPAGILIKIVLAQLGATAANDVHICFLHLRGCSLDHVGHAAGLALPLPRLRGCSRIQRQRTKDWCPLLASAGMFPPRPHLRRRQGSAPHICGDVPRILAFFGRKGARLPALLGMFSRTT